MIEGQMLLPLPPDARPSIEQRKWTMQEYKDTKSLQHAHLMIMADPDDDGSHVKGLLMNFLHVFWPSLPQIHGFLVDF